MKTKKHSQACLEAHQGVGKNEGFTCTDKCLDKVLANSDGITAYENGELNETQIIELFSSLLRSGLAWQLQGHYGRTAADFINAGVLTAKGEII